MSSDRVTEFTIDIDKFLANFKNKFPEFIHIDLGLGIFNRCRWFAGGQ